MDVKVQSFKDKINTTNDRFFSALDDFKKYYVYYNKNPEVDEFQNYYTNSRGQLQTLNRELFLTTNDIGKTMEFLDEKVTTIALKLAAEKKKNIELTKLLPNIKNTQNGSEILVNDSKSLYSTQYANNVEIFIGIVVVAIMLGTLFKTKLVATVSK